MPRSWHQTKSNRSGYISEATTPSRVFTLLLTAPVQPLRSNPAYARRPPFFVAENSPQSVRHVSLPCCLGAYE
jgi:hypothetical protein